MTSEFVKGKEATGGLSLFDCGLPLRDGDILEFKMLDPKLASFSTYGPKGLFGRKRKKVD